MDTWDIVGLVINAITVISLGILLWQVIILNKQTRILNLQTRLSVFNSILQYWGGKEGRRARRYVIRKFKFTEEDKLENCYNDDYEDNLDDVEEVLAMCNRISFLTLKGFIPEKDVLEMVGRPIIRCWNKTEHFVKKRREDQGDLEDGNKFGYVYYLEEFVNKYKGELGMEKPPVVA